MGEWGCFGMLSGGEGFGMVCFEGVGTVGEGEGEGAEEGAIRGVYNVVCEDLQDNLIIYSTRNRVKNVP